MLLLKNMTSIELLMNFKVEMIGSRYYSHDSTVQHSSSGRQTERGPAAVVGTYSRNLPVLSDCQTVEYEYRYRYRTGTVVQQVVVCDVLSDCTICTVTLLVQ